MRNLYIFGVAASFSEESADTISKISSFFLAAISPGEVVAGSGKILSHSRRGYKTATEDLRFSNRLYRNRLQ